MQGPVYVSLVQAQPAAGPDKRVCLPAEPEVVVMGAHGEIAALLGVAPDHPPHATTLDYVVGAAAACLAGTFARALAARGVAAGAHTVEARGEVYDRARLLKLERIIVRHRLRLPGEQHATARAAHERYERSCPVSRSLEGAIAIVSELELSDA